ncbi:hypothetical protein DL771_002966 [Monosporascus sp. 5C6A]|nr:hypothetical protein DL771_002966 [Monosporascus sp. 5C6A]
MTTLSAMSNLATGLEMMKLGSYEHDVDYSNSYLLCQRVGSLLALAFAVFDLETAFGESDRVFYGNPRSPLDVDADDIISFIDIHFPHQTTGVLVPKRRLSTDDVVKLLQFDDVVNYYATIMAESALGNIPGQKGNRNSCSETEIGRFKKSLYLLHLASSLFPRDDQRNAAIRQRAEDIEPAWRHFWLKFAPWELQQTRCVQELLAVHVRSVLKSDASKLGKRVHTCLDLKLLKAFVANEGLAALRKLEGLGSQRGLETSLAAFLAFGVGWMRHEPWNYDQDTIYLKQAADLSHLDLTTILRKYPEAESGPQDVWMYTLLRVHVDDVMFSRGIHFLQCGQHATLWAYPFWDRERLDAITNGALPATAEMESVGDVYVFTKDVEYYADFRLPTYCTCKTSE